jgi:3-dehydroquinate dehydratase
MLSAMSDRFSPAWLKVWLGVIVGLGAAGYRYALLYALDHTKKTG